MPRAYRDRRDAGRALAEALGRYRDRSDVLVLALPRGGVPVASEVAEALGAPLDLLLVRKLGVPRHEELAMGAIATGGVRVVNEDIVRSLGITPDVIEQATALERSELQRREQSYRGDRPVPEVRGRCVILVDDGLATGATMRAAAGAMRQAGAAERVVAVPVAPPDTVESLRQEVDEVVCPLTPTPFYGVGGWYEDFTQTTDDEVRDLLARAWQRQPSDSQSS